MKMSKRLFSLVLSFMLVASIFVLPAPITVQAETLAPIEKRLADLGYALGSNVIGPDTFDTDTVNEKTNHDTLTNAQVSWDSVNKQMKFDSNVRYMGLYYELDSSLYTSDQLIEFDVYGTNTKWGRFTYAVTKGVGNANSNASVQLGANKIYTQTHISILWDYTNKRYTAWIGNDMVSKDFSVDGNAKYLEFWCELGTESEPASDTSLFIDNIKQTALDDMLPDITSEFINNGDETNTAVGHLHLPKVTPTGSYPITWTSNEFITVDRDVELGRLNGSRTEQSTGTVTASVVIEGVTYKRTLSYTLPVNTLPEIDTSVDMIFDWSTINTNVDVATAMADYNTNGGRLNVKDLKFENGQLVTTSSAEVNHQIYFRPDVTDRLVYEFDVKRNIAGKKTEIYICYDGNTGSGAKTYLTLNGNYVQAYINGTNENLKTDYTRGNKFSHIVLMYEQCGAKETTITDNKYKWSMWLDGVNINLDGSDSMDPRAKIVDLTKFYGISFSSKTSTTLTIDNLNVYQAIDQDQKAVDELAASIDIAATKDPHNGAVLSLKTSEDGCNISYTANDIISADGTITKPEFDTECEAELTITKGEASKTVTKTITVAGRYYIGDIEYSGELNPKGENNASLVAYKRVEDARSIFAAVAYYAENSLIGISAKTIDLPHMDNADVTHEFKCTLNTDSAVSGNDFIWESGTLKPLKKNSEITLPVYFADNMVLQRGEKAVVWGKTRAKVPVSVSYNGISADGISDDDGNFSLSLGTINEANNGSDLTVTAAGMNKTLKNVAVGDVWLISGQSNAEYSMATLLSTHSDNDVQIAEKTKLENDIKTAQNSNVRFMKMGYEDINATTAGPVRDEYYTAPNTFAWREVNPDTIDYMGALSYYFADYLEGETNIPIGIINSAKAGKSIVQFVRNGAYRKSTSAIAYNEQIAPVLKLKIKGMLWDQGEQDRTTSNYNEILLSMINDLRSENGFNNPDMPFIYVQLQRFQREYSGSYITYEYIREQMRRFEDAENNIHMAVSIDLNPDDWTAIDYSMLNHPLGKDRIGERMALKALRYVYGKNVVASGPLYDKHEIQDDGSVVVSFKADSIGGGLEIRNSDNLEGFELLGNDGVFHEAQAQIEGGTVKLTGVELGASTQVRYIYAMYPEKITLFNSEGLPASPFATDNTSYVPHPITE